MPKRIYATVRDVNTRANRATLVSDDGRTFAVQLNPNVVTNNETLRAGLRMRVTLDDSERSILSISRG